MHPCFVYLVDLFAVTNIYRFYYPHCVLNSVLLGLAS